MGRSLNPQIVPYTKADKSTSYRVRIRINGKQTSETFDNLVSAQAFVAQVKDPSIGVERAVQLRDREDTRAPGYVPTLREALEHHVTTLTGVDDETRIDYVRVAKRTWLPVLGSLRVDECGRADIARWVNKAAGTMAPKSIRNAHSILSATLNTAMLDGHLAANPARGTRLPRAGEENVEDIKFLTYAEFDLLHAEIPADYQPMNAWMFGVGTRWGETTAQQKRDLDLAAGMWANDTWTSAPTTRVVRAWKKGGGLGPPKSQAGRRTIVLPVELVDIVEPLLDGLAADAFIFRTRTGSPVTHSNFFNRVWKPATLRATVCPAHRDDRCRCLSAKPYLCTVHTAKDENGHQILPEPCGCSGTLPFRPRIHDARHTHASWLIAQGERLDVIQDRLGHEDYLTTQRLYGHLLPDARQGAGRAASMAFAFTSLRAVRALPSGE